MATTSREDGGGRRAVLRVFIVGVPLIALGALFWLFRSAREVPPEPPVDTTPRAVARAEAQVAAAVREVDAARRDARAGRARPYRIAVRQNDVNTLLRTDRRAKKLLKRHKVERPRIEIKNGRLKASGLVSLQGQRLYVTAEGPVTPGKDGRLGFRPTQVWVGKVRAPARVTRDIARRAARAFQRGELKLPGQVAAVRLENGQLVIEGTTGR